jgi:hypothetical protein
MAANGIMFVMDTNANTLTVHRVTSATTIAPATLA